MCSLSYTPLPEITLLRDKVEDREITDFWCLLASHMTKVSTNHRFKLISADQDVEAEVRGPFLSSRVNSLCQSFVSSILICIQLNFFKECVGCLRTTISGLLKV